MTDPPSLPSNLPRRVVDSTGPQPGERPEDWFRRTFGEMPPPIHETPDGSAESCGVDRRQAALAALERSIPESYRWARFSAGELKGRIPAPAIARAEDAWRDDRVCLMGAARAGKTSLAVAMARRRVSESARAGVFVHAYKLGVARILHPATRGRPEIVELAIEARYAAPATRRSRRRARPRDERDPDVLVERHAGDRPTYDGPDARATREALWPGSSRACSERGTLVRVGAETPREKIDARGR